MKKKINITLDEEVIKKIKKLAKERHSNFSATINQILWEKLNMTGEIISDLVSQLAKSPALKQFIKAGKKQNDKRTT